MDFVSSEANPENILVTKKKELNKEYKVRTHDYDAKIVKLLAQKNQLTYQKALELKEFAKSAIS